MRTNRGAVLFLSGFSLVVFNPCARAHTDVTAEQARELIDSTDHLVVLDVREPSEYCDAGGHIPEALNYPWNSGVLRAEYRELWRGGPVLVVCHDGDRSNRAAIFLEKSGFSQVYNLLGGMSAWTWETEPCKYPDGCGTAADPYHIATAEDLMLLGDSTEDYDKHFILVADIDLDPNLPGRKVFSKAVVARDRGGAQYVFEGTPFTGVFDGDGHTISHLTIVGGIHLGLLGRLDPGGEVRNLGILDIAVTGSDSNVGGLVGCNGGSITNCYSTGAVNGADDFVGGLVGRNINYGSIIASYSTCSVTGGGSLGATGGLVGRNSGIVAASHSTAAVTGDKNVGGFVGINYGGNITACYSAGRVAGNENVGGFAGDNVSGNGMASGFGIVSSFWDVQVSGQTTSNGGTGLPTIAMQDLNTYLDAGWDFSDEISNGTCDSWHMPPADYPKLKYCAGITPVMSEGSGTSDEPYLIRDAWNLGKVLYEPTAHYRLEASVDLVGIRWIMAAVPYFGGTFDGNGYAIRNLHIQGGGRVGMFGYLASKAAIRNLRLEGIHVFGVGDRVGGIAGENAGSITASYTTGTVNGTADYVGGLVGINWRSIENSYSATEVTGDKSVGGLVGRNYLRIAAGCSVGTVTGTENVGGLVGTHRSSGKITTSYNTAAVTGSRNVGGLVGINYRGAVTGCYSAGIISGNSRVGGLVGGSTGGNVGECFWDTQTSGQVTSAGGTGKNTTEMQTASTFLDTGWDFVAETVNGKRDTWWILEGKDYPRLSWELPAEYLVVVVDDFESYNDEVGNRIFDIWIDGYNTPENGSSVGCGWPGDWECPRMSRDGIQSMPIRYDNSGTAHVSEAERAWDVPQDWTIGGADTLALYFRGETNNSPEFLYMAVEDSAQQIAVVTFPDADAVLATEWQRWHISLNDLWAQGVDIASVEKMYIGVGNRNNPQSGGTGRVYIDDIHLINLML